MDQMDSKTHLQRFVLKALLFLSIVTTGSFESATNRADQIEGRCRDDWIHHGESCFQLFMTRKKWIDARDYCTSAAKGKLATIPDKETNDFILRELYPKAGTSVWIGLNDRAKEGHFVWTGSNSKANFTYWKKDEPNNTGNQDCVDMWDAYHGEWDDNQCYRKFPFICERPDFKVELCGETFNKPYGYLQSPGFQHNQTIAMHCSWTIENKQKVDLTFVFFGTFDLPDDDACDSQSVRIYVGDRLTHEYCGTAVPPPFRSHGEKVTVEYYALRRVNPGKGFSIIWTDD